MSELITLPRNSPEFESYLRGNFSKEKRALPMQTLNVNSPSETVTFRVLPLTQIQRPGFFVRLLTVFKVRSFLLVLLPMFVVLAKNLTTRQIQDPVVVTLSTIGVLFALLSMNLRNEYVDHIKGVDRVLSETGSRAIQKGWVSAAQVQFYSSIWLALALLCSLPVLFATPKVLLVILPAIAVGLWAQFKKSDSFKYQRGGEFSLFLLLGPFLCLGYQQSMGVDWDWQTLWTGVLWGLLVLFLHHVRSFLDIFSSTQAGFTNTINWLGFDKSRRLLAAWWGCVVVGSTMFHGFYSSLQIAILNFIFLGAAAVPFTINLKKLSSPMGSQMRVVYRRGYFLFLLATGLWFFESLWSIL